MIRARDIYVPVCHTLLEGNGLVLGIISEQDFLRYLRETVVDLLGSSMAFCGQVLPIHGAQDEYRHSENLSDVDTAFYDAAFIPRTFRTVAGERTAAGFDGQDPECWHTDQLDIEKVRVIPAPAYEGNQSACLDPPGYGVISEVSGANDFDITLAPESMVTFGTVSSDVGSVPVIPENIGLGIPAFICGARTNLLAIGPAQFARDEISLDSPIDVVDEDFDWALVYGVLSRIFSSDTEAKDIGRARYCAARFLEAKNLMNSVIGEMREE